MKTQPFILMCEALGTVALPLGNTQLTGGNSGIQNCPLALQSQITTFEVYIKKEKCG